MPYISQTQNTMIIWKKDLITLQHVPRPTSQIFMSCFQQLVTGLIFKKTIQN